MNFKGSVRLWLANLGKDNTVKKRPMRQPTFYNLTEVKLVILNVIL